MPRLSTRREFVLSSVAGSLTSLLPSSLMAQVAGYIRSDFDASSTAEEVTLGLDLSDKTILVTGANSGLGFETMRVLALRGAHVLAAARNSKKAKTAAGSVAGKVTPVVCELTDFESVVDCATAVEKLGGTLDGLICNAGIMGTSERQVVRGLEKQFVVNYLGHFLLAQRLLPLLESAPQGRLVMVSSGLYTKAPAAGIEFDDLAAEKSYDRFAAYGQSKLAMALFAAEFSRRFPGNNVTANALYPGVINTELFRHQPWYLKLGLTLGGWAFMKSAEEGAATQCYVATHPALANVSGQFFADCNPIVPEGPHVSDSALAERLWDVSIELTDDYLNQT
jgi:NAD(P)-dependent dehydrogenase (short-subunit alcohol dehydrogenase family)